MTNEILLRLAKERLQNAKCVDFKQIDGNGSIRYGWTVVFWTHLILLVENNANKNWFEFITQQHYKMCLELVKYDNAKYVNSHNPHKPATLPKIAENQKQKTIFYASLLDQAKEEYNRTN